MLALFLSTATIAQSKFGVFGGLNFSMYTNGFAKDITGDNSYGIQIGVLYELPLSDKVSFRPKLVYSQQGDRRKSMPTAANSFSFDPNFDPSYGLYDTSNLEPYQLDYRLNYLDVSLDFKFWNKIYVLAGPQIGFLVSQKSEGIYIGPVKSTIDIGLNLGTGFTINNAFVEFGVYQGSTTLWSYPYYATGNIVNLRNGLAKVTLGYSFN